MLCQSLVRMQNDKEFIACNNNKFSKTEIISHMPKNYCKGFKLYPICNNCIYKKRNKCIGLCIKISE